MTEFFLDLERASRHRDRPPYRNTQTLKAILCLLKLYWASIIWTNNEAERWLANIRLVGILHCIDHDGLLVAKI